MIEELIQLGGPGALLIAAVVWILDNRGMISSKNNGVDDRLSAALDALKTSLHEDSERNSVEHKHITENLLLLTQSHKETKKEVHEVNLFVREK